MVIRVSSSAKRPILGLHRPLGTRVDPTPAPTQSGEPSDRPQAWAQSWDVAGELFRLETTAHDGEGSVSPGRSPRSLVLVTVGH